MTGGGTESGRSVRRRRRIVMPAGTAGARVARTVRPATIGTGPHRSRGAFSPVGRGPDAGTTTRSARGRLRACPRGASVG